MFQDVDHVNWTLDNLEMCQEFYVIQNSVLSYSHHTRNNTSKQASQRNIQ